MRDVQCDVAQGTEDEVALVHVGMGDGELGSIYDEVVVEEDVEVEGAGSPALAADPAGGLFDVAEVGEQVAGGEGGEERDGGVEVGVLAGRADGFGFVSSGLVGELGVGQVAH